MELTPIKIRGKRREHEHPAVLAAAKAKSSSRLRTKTRKSSSIESKEQQNPPTKKRKKKKKKPTTPAMPTLQGLPQELLEIIFLDSMNISLPRCSPSLGRKLSSRTVAMEFTMNSFFHTVDHRTIYRDRKNTSDPHVQSDILACRFFTYDFFLAYVQRAHDAMRELRGEIWEATGIKILGVEAFEGLYPFKFTKIVNLGFAHGFHIPEKLLHGPWTQDKASLLYVLVSMNGEIDWKGSMAGEAAKSGMNSAIEEGNERAVAALAVLLGVPKAITTETLRYAVIHCNCNINIVRHLLFNAQILARETPEHVLNFHDPALWAWADVNGHKGMVLKDMLKRAEAFDLEFYFEDNADWRKVVSFPYSGSKFDAFTPFGDIVRELLINLYRNYGRKLTRRAVIESTEEAPMEQSDN